MTDPTPARNGLAAMSRSADLLLLCSIVAETIGALAIGAQYGTSGLAVACSLPLLGASLLAFATLRGSAVSRYMLTFAACALVMLHIELARGVLEFHFGVFAVLAMALAYRDRSVLIFGAALFVVHHVLFDRLQLLNLGIYCTPQPDLSKIVLHAGYVIAQTAIEGVLAGALRRAALEAGELETLLAGVDRDGVLHLDTGTQAVTSRNALLLKNTLARMHAVIVEVGTTVGSLESTAREMSSGNQDLGNRTQAAVSTLETTAHSMRDLAQSVHATAETAQRADALATEASASAAQGNDAVARMVETMSGIAASSGRIAEITSVIDGIAFQTNLLALNAAVEAARAGEQGRGFAVVAGEVRSLAHRAADAAKEIKTLVDDSAARVDDGMRLASSAGERMGCIVDQATRVGTLIGEISGSTREQARGLESIGSSVSTLDAATRDNATLVSEAAASTQRMREQALRLQEAAGRFA